MPNGGRVVSAPVRHAVTWSGSGHSLSKNTHSPNYQYRYPPNTCAYWEDWLHYTLINLLRWLIFLLAILVAVKY
jgi:hypothetical protein